MIFSTIRKVALWVGCDTANIATGEVLQVDGEDAVYGDFGWI